MVFDLSSFSVRIRSRITGTSALLMPAVGSSNMKTCGSSAISIATSSLRWSPCGRLLATASWRASRRTPLQQSIGPRQRLSRRTLQRFDHRCEAFAPLRLHRQAHVLQHRQAREELGQLEGAAKAALGCAPRRGTRDVVAVEMAPSPALAFSCPEIRLK